MVQRKLCRMAAFQCIDVYVVLEFCYPPLDISARMANHVFASGKKGFFRHPDDTGLQPIFDMGEIPFFDDHVTAADIYFILKFQYDGLGRECFFQISVRSNDPLDPAVLKRRQRYDRVTPADGSGGNGTGEPPEIEIGAYDCLYRKAEIPEIPAVAGIQRFQDGKQMISLVPGRFPCCLRHIFPFNGGNGNETNVRDIQLLREASEFFFNLPEFFFRVIQKIHLVDGYDEVPYFQKRGDERMPLRLCEYSVAGINQDDGRVRRGSSGGHVPCVLFMAGTVGNDEFAAGGGEVPVGYINGYSLFPFRFKAVQQQGVINVACPRSSIFFTGFAQFCQLVVENQFAVIKKASDECRFPVVHGTAGKYA